MPDLRRSELLRMASAGLGFLALFLALYFFWSRPEGAAFRLKATAGDEHGHRNELARLLAEEARDLGVHLDLQSTSGSAEALERVNRGEMDLALVQGGLPHGPQVRQVASLLIEPLHLLVRPELEAAGLEGLRGKRLNLSTAGSGTRILAVSTLRFAGFEPGRDYTESNLSYGELESLPPEELPDGVFVVSALPSRVASQLIEGAGYRLQPLPFGRALSLRDANVEDAQIPAFAYRVVPPVPATDIHTVGTHLLLVTHAGVPDEPILRLLTAIFEREFSRKAQLKRLPTELLGHREVTLHDGARTWLERKDPVVTSETIDNLESMRSFLVSVAVALFLLWRWQRGRRYAGFEDYMDQVNRIEKQALEIEASIHLDLPRLVKIRGQLSALKVEALENFTQGELRGEELMAAFLTHVSDVRTYLNTLVMHERDRLEKAARAGDDHHDDRRFGTLWKRALREGVESGHLQRPSERLENPRPRPAADPAPGAEQPDVEGL